jgi:hypothetical protein
VKTFKVTIWTDVWGDKPVPDSYVTDPIIEARDSIEASLIARERWPHAHRTLLTPIPPGKE